jgi:predicted RNase H-like HicB family nuclease
MFIPIAINHSFDNNYAVLFPTLLGCHSMGITINEAIENAKEAAQGYIEIMLEDGVKIETPLYNLHELMLYKEYEDCVWKIIKIPDLNTGN